MHSSNYPTEAGVHYIRESKLRKHYFPKVTRLWVAELTSCQIQRPRMPTASASHLIAQGGVVVVVDVLSDNPAASHCLSRVRGPLIPAP